jgi:ribosomal protein S18 acetylase RimI-like enzyme
MNKDLEFDFEFIEIIKDNLEDVLGDKTMFIEKVFHNFMDLQNQKEVVHSKEYIEELLVSDFLFGYFVVENNKLIAYLLGEVLHDSGITSYFLNYIFVGTNYRKQKIASQLIEKVKEYIRKENIQEILLVYDSTKQELNNFYNKHNFKKSNLVNTKKNILVSFCQKESEK